MDQRLVAPKYPLTSLRTQSHKNSSNKPINQLTSFVQFDTQARFDCKLDQLTNIRKYLCSQAQQRVAKFVPQGGQT